MLPKPWLLEPRSPSLITESSSRPIPGTGSNPGNSQIYDLTVYLRPYPAVTVLRNMTKDLGEKRGVLVGQDYWQLPKSTLRKAAK